jgi:hypothetical protein
VKIKVPLEVAAVLLVSTLAFHFYRQTSDAPMTEALRRSTETADKRQLDAPKEEFRKRKIVPEYRKPSEAGPEPGAEKSAPQPPARAAKREEGEAASFDRRLESQSVEQPRAVPAPMARRAEPERSRDVQRPASPLPGPPVRELVAKDPAAYENRVKGMLETYGGKLLARKEELGAIYLTTELPQSRAAEFLAALSDDPSLPERPQERALSPPAGRLAGEAGSKDAGSKAILNLLIRPEK